MDVAVARTVALRGDARYIVGFKIVRKANDVWTDIRNRARQLEAGLAYRC